MDVKLYLALAGSLGIAYVTYNYFSKPKNIILSQQLTRRICQQIKHQMMIVCITYSKAMKKIRQDNSQKLRGKAQQVFMQFRNQLSQVYVAKQNLILRKFVVTRQTYGKSLQRWKKDKQIQKNIQQILNMMQRALNGQTPDFKVHPEVYKAFGKQQLCQIYKQMVTLIGKKVTHKLRQQVQKNKNFNPASDDDFRNAIRQLSIYDVKVNYLRLKGFKDQWGCPNQVFFKYLEDQKTKDQVYQKKVVAYQKCYQKIIQLVSVDPMKMTDHQIDEMFEKAEHPVTSPTKPYAPSAAQNVQPVVQQPIKVASVQQPKASVSVKTAPKKSDPVDQEAQLEALMMQQLLSRSQQPQRSISSSLDDSIKLGLTSSQIQNDWQRNASLTQKPITKMQQATQDLLLGRKDSVLIKNEMKVVEQALRAQQIQQRNEKQEQQDQQQVNEQSAVVQVVPQVVEAPIVQPQVVQEPVVVSEAPIQIIAVESKIEVVTEIIEEPAHLQESNPKQEVIVNDEEVPKASQDKHEHIHEHVHEHNHEHNHE